MPDNFVQQPENTQNYNRYAYVLNNPLRYTDPSGEIIPFLAAVAIGAFIGAATYYVGLHGQEAGWSWSGVAQATFIGAVSAAVTFGIGSASSALFSNFYSQAAFQAVAHGSFQGGMTAVNGGNFWQGFAAGALSSIASSAWSGTAIDSNGQAIAGTGFKSLSSVAGNVGQIAFGTVMGGVGALLTKGNFWQGAVTGLVVSGLNHYAHSSKTKINSKTDASPGPPGEVEFKKLSEEQLKEFRVIQEDEIQNAPLTTPQNNTVYKVDGFYQKQFTDNKYWYKIGNGNRVTVSYSNGGYVFKTITFSNWGYFSSVGYLPKQEDHWYRPTVNSPYGNPFDLNNFKK